MSEKEPLVFKNARIITPMRVIDNSVLIAIEPLDSSIFTFTVEVEQILWMQQGKPWRRYQLPMLKVA